MSEDFSSRSATYGQYVRHGGFTVADLSLSKKLWDFEDKGRLTLKVKINNLTYKYYDYILDFPMPGRNFYTGLAYGY